LVLLAALEGHSDFDLGASSSLYLTGSWTSINLEDRESGLATKLISGSMAGTALLELDGVLGTRRDCARIDSVGGLTRLGSGRYVVLNECRLSR
jgi:hypothetical protein